MGNPLINIGESQYNTGLKNMRKDWGKTVINGVFCWEKLRAQLSRMPRVIYSLGIKHDLLEIFQFIDELPVKPFLYMGFT